LLAAFRAGVEEAKRRERRRSAGPFGQFDGKESRLLRDLFSDLEDHLLSFSKSEDKSSALLAEYQMRTDYRNQTPVPADVALVLRLLNSIHSAARCVPDRFAELALGSAGVTGSKMEAARKAGGRSAAEKRKRKAEKRHLVWVKSAERLRRGGTQERYIAAIVAGQFKRTPQQVRSVLKKAKV
jgi:hypothetical protein